MFEYYVNKNPQENGDHEIHKPGCRYFPRETIRLGYFLYCKDATAKAMQIYPQSNGCYHCNRECHTQ